jgi:hypothetical protein
MRACRANVGWRSDVDHTDLYRDACIREAGMAGGLVDTGVT